MLLCGRVWCGVSCGEVVLYGVLWWEVGRVVSRLSTYRILAVQRVSYTAQRAFVDWLKDFPFSLEIRVFGAFTHTLSLAPAFVDHRHNHNHRILHHPVTRPTGPTFLVRKILEVVLIEWKEMNACNQTRHRDHKLFMHSSMNAPALQTTRSLTPLSFSDQIAGLTPVLPMLAPEQVRLLNCDAVNALPSTTLSHSFR